MTLQFNIFLAAALAAMAAVAEDAGMTGVHGYTPKGYVPVTEPEVLENIERFRDMKLGLMMHFGIYAQAGIDESWPLVDTAVWRARQMTDMGEGDEFKKNYWNLNKSFNPVRYDPKAWARVAARNGFKYLCFTSKHHDGFCMWDTKYTDYKVTSPDCPYSRSKHPDILKATYDAFRAEGLAISLYFSKGDWHHPDYWDNLGLGYRTTWLPSYDPDKEPERWQRFKDFTWNQILELMKNYGRFEILWLDCAAVGCQKNTRIDIPGLMDECRKVQPWLICADRCIGGRAENLLTPEQCVPPEPMLCPWESCVTMASNWSYRYDDEYKSTKELLDLLIGVVAKGGCLVLNVAPRPDGVIAEPALKRMNEMGDWLRRNGEAIYGTRPVAPYMKRNWAFTQKNGVVYAIRKTNSGERNVQQVVLPPETTTGEIAKIVHLSSGRECPFEKTPDGWRVKFPEGAEFDVNADAFRLNFAETPVPQNNDPIPYETVDMSKLKAEFTTDWDGVTSRRCGEPTTARIRLLLDGRPQAIKGIRLRVDDWVKPIGTETVDVPAEGYAFAPSTLKTPGFLRFTAFVGKKDFMRSVPYEPERLVKGSPTPADFMDYWRGEIARLEADGRDEPTMVPVTTYGKAFDAWRVSFATVGGKRVYGVLTVPKERGKEPLPVRFEMPSAGQPTPTYPASWIYSHHPEPNAVSMTIFAHCAEIDVKEVRDAYFERIRREHKEKYGVGYYPDAGISDGREAYHFHPVFLGAVRAVKWLHRQPYVDRSRFTYQGASQGGYFGFVLAGLTPCFTKVVAIVPAGTDTMGYLAGRCSGWPRLIETQRKENRAAAEKWAPYFDAANFAPYVTAPIRVLCGCIDTTCPPTCVASAFNALGSKDKAIVFMPAHGHGSDAKCVEALRDWRCEKSN